MKTISLFNRLFKKDSKKQKTNADTLKGEYLQTRTVIQGIGRDAERLGVSRYHLGEVIRGRRSSPGLLERYRAMKGGKRC